MTQATLKRTERALSLTGQAMTQGCLLPDGPVYIPTGARVKTLREYIDEWVALCCTDREFDVPFHEWLSQQLRDRGP